MVEQLAPKKSLGQHFLKNPAICARIASFLNSSANDNILEIGPGPGALTRELAKLPHTSLILLEKDPRWLKISDVIANAQGILADALRFDWKNLSGPWLITGNLPYNIASSLIWDILSRCEALKKAVFMVQKEVALRLSALPGGKTYGALGVWAQSFAIPKLEMSLGPGAFFPPPKVDSAVISFLPLSKEKWPQNPNALKKILDLCFQKRRKQLGAIFRQAGATNLLEALKKLDINPEARPETLSVTDFHRLATFLHQ